MTPPPSPELLAPAGSLEAFFAAMEAGADAVYTGLKDFSARAKAKNVTLGELERMLGYARGQGRRVYVTLNTLVKEAELPQLVETLAALEAMDIDAVILQDLAVWRLARRHFPGLELHASTQLTVHNAAGVRMLEQMGFTRGVLARELSLDEIAAIRRQTTLELEHFVHGALCFSFSGQCYFSSFLGGKSGNRGRCAQPCRRRYRYRGQDGYYFSTNDLSAIDLLPELAAAGVISFKIEGRMKSAEYVSSVVGAYRQVLDAVPAGAKEAIRAAKERLKLSFGRVPTKGFLPGGVPTDIAIPSLTGATGRFLGELTQVHGSNLVFKTRDRLHLGDRLRVQPQSDRAGSAFTVKELQLGKRPAKVAPAGSLVCVPSPFRDTFKVGDAVFKVSSEQAFTLSEAACRRRLAQAPPVTRGVSLEIAMPTPQTLAIQARCAGIELQADYPVGSFPATERPLDAATLEGVFARTANAPFRLEYLSAGDLPPVVIPPSRLKEIRRDLYQQLAAKLLAERQQLRHAAQQAALADLLPPALPRPARQRLVSIIIPGPRDAQLLSDPEIDRLLIPLTPGTLQEFERTGRRLSGQARRVVWDLPPIILDSQWPSYREAVQRLQQRGFANFRLNNLSHFQLVADLLDVQLSTGYRLFSLNSQALLAWKELGAVEATLYIEDDRVNLTELLARDAGLATAVTVYAPIPLITSRIPLRGMRPDSPVVSDRGKQYRVVQRAGLSVLSSETDFSLLGQLEILQAAGCERLIVDLSHLGPFSPRGRQVLEALRRGQELAGTTTFNFLTHLE
jgi:U32 family peptidase